MSLDSIEKARNNMVEQQVRPWQVEDARVLALLAKIRREDFVPTAFKSLAFADFAIPLGHGQRMLEPRIQARLIQDAEVRGTDLVLEIGSGTGYMTALLAQQAAKVISYEINPDLADQARRCLISANIDNVEVRTADGASGAPADGPFDVIVLGGSVQSVPQVLLRQLKIGGRLVGIVGSEPIMHAQTITRSGVESFRTIERWDDNAPALINFPTQSNFRF